MKHLLDVATIGTNPILSNTNVLNISEVVAIVEDRMMHSIPSIDHGYVYIYIYIYVI